ncbi:hypothetical protein [Paraburkholderia sp. GAS334]|uniref:hypothetical protein n=1 Tax=Paraburkholderia sp. GAS334 TaxID=3035131 RepID=UPI003D1B3714
MKAYLGNQSFSKKISQKTNGTFGNFFIRVKYTGHRLFHSSDKTPGSTQSLVRRGFGKVLMKAGRREAREGNDMPLKRSEVKLAF